MLSIWMLFCPLCLCSSVSLFNRDSIPGPVPVKYDLHFSLYCPQRSCNKVMFLHLCVILFTRGDLCPNMHLRSHDQGISVQGSLSGGSLSGGLCPGGSLSGGGGFCPGGSQSRGSLSGRETLYGNARMVRILLERIIVINVFILFGHVKTFVR